MITMYRIMTGKDKVDPALWFAMAPTRSGAASTRQTRGWQNVEKPARAKHEVKKDQFGQRVVDGWTPLPH